MRLLYSRNSAIARMIESGSSISTLCKVYISQIKLWFRYINLSLLYYVTCKRTVHSPSRRGGRPHSPLFLLHLLLMRRRLRILHGVTGERRGRRRGPAVRLLAALGEGARHDPGEHPQEVLGHVPLGAAVEALDMN